MSFTPHDAATNAIGRARSLLFHSRVAPSPANLPAAVRADLQRNAIVMAVAALDLYMHRLIVARAYEHEKLPTSLAKLPVPFEEYLEQADKTARAARAKEHQTRPRVHAKRVLRERLSTRTFQSFDDVGKALAMSGRKSDWEGIGKQMTPQLTPEELRKQLDSIVARRNRIVHEGDYERLDRPQSAKLNEVGLSEANQMVAFLMSLIDAIHAVA